MGFEKLTAYLDAIPLADVPALDCSVYVHHQPVYRHFRGYSDSARQKPMDGQETYYLFSATKLFTCTAALQLIEQGKLGLDDPVYRYLPNYQMLTVAENDMTRAARNVLTIRHLMSMQSGLDYDLNAKAITNVQTAMQGKATTRQIVDAIAHKPLSFDPGTSYQYSLSHDVLAAVIEVVSGQSFGEYLKDHVMAPLGIHQMGFRLTDELKAHQCALYMRNNENTASELTENYNPYILSDVYESGGAGLIGGVSEYALLVDALACGGVGKTGARILKPETIELYRTPQLCEKAYDAYLIRCLGYTYGLGVRVMIKPELCHAKSPVGEFGWDGAAGAYAMIDPSHELSIFHAQNVRNYQDCYFIEHPKIRDLVYESLGF